MDKRTRWLMERQKGIGGSEIAAVCGLSKWRTPLDVWTEKVNPITEESPNLAMELGSYLEPLIIKKYEAETGYTVRTSLEAITHEEHTFARCNLDGFIIPDTGDPGVLEAKTSGDSRQWGEPGTDDVPMDYFCQVQWNMLIAGLEWADIPVLFFDRNRRIEIYSIERDEAFQMRLLEKAKAFWKCVVENIVPDPKTSDEASQAWPDHERGTSVQAEEDTVCAIEQLKAIRKEMAELKEACSMLEAQIKGHMKEAEKLTDGDRVLATWRTALSSRIDSAALRKEMPEIAKQFTKTTNSRRFLIK